MEYEWGPVFYFQQKAVKPLQYSAMKYTRVLVLTNTGEYLRFNKYSLHF